MHNDSNWRWHLDEEFLRINGATHSFWCAVDCECEVLEVFTKKRQDRKAKFNFLTLAMIWNGLPKVIATNQHRTALDLIGNTTKQEWSRRLNNRAENSHQLFRRQEGATPKLWDMKTLQKFASAHASFHNHANFERHLNRRDICKHDRAAALAEGCQLAA